MAYSVTSDNNHHCSKRKPKLARAEVLVKRITRRTITLVVTGMAVRLAILMLITSAQEISMVLGIADSFPTIKRSTDR